MTDAERTRRRPPLYIRTKLLPPLAMFAPASLFFAAVYFLLSEALPAGNAVAVSGLAALILTVLSWATVLPWALGIVERRMIRSLLREVLERPTLVDEVVADLEHWDLSRTRASVTLTRAHVAAVLDRYEQRRSDSAATEVRAWAQAVCDLRGDGIEPPVLIRFETGYTTALYVVLASLANAESPWYDFTTELSMAGMRKHLDIADSAAAPRAP